MLVLAVLSSACSAHTIVLTRDTPAMFAQEPRGFETADVVEVIDGDTIRVEVTDRTDGPGAGDTVPGTVYTVRLIGIDAPESVDPRTPVECFGREAKAAATALLEGSEVRLVKDVEDTDGFGRLLRYVYFGDELANARLVANGYAYAFTHPPNVRHSGLFVEMHREARAFARGLWASDTCDGKRN